MEDALGRKTLAPAATRARRRPTVAVTEDACDACGACVESCPRGAIALQDVAVIDPRLCFGCGVCVAACASGALELTAV